MKESTTFWANIYVGLREEYDGKTHYSEWAIEICQDYCTEVGLGVTVTETIFVYSGGREPGIIVGLIQYPRFPTTELDIMRKAKELGRRLMIAFNQLRISIVTTHRTVMFERGDFGEYTKI